LVRVVAAAGEVAVRPERARVNREAGPTPVIGDRRCWTLFAAGVAGALLLSVACAGDDGGDGASDAAADGASSRLDTDRVHDQIVRLLADYDAVVNQIIAEPEVTGDPSGPLVEQYLDLFEPDSEFAGQALETWRANAADGISIEPYTEGHPANLTRLDGDIDIVSDDEVRFPTCSEFRQLVYRGDRVVEGLPYMEQPGESVAVRIDGGWVLRRRDVFTDVPECATDNPDAPDIPEAPDVPDTTEDTAGGR
jgi:hypothetical protein